MKVVDKPPLYSYNTNERLRRPPMKLPKVPDQDVFDGYVLEPQDEEKVLEETFAPNPKLDAAYKDFSFDGGLGPSLPRAGLSK